METTQSRAPPPNPVALAFAVAQLQSGRSRTSEPANDAASHPRGNNDVLAELMLADALMTFHENSSRDDTLYTPTSTKSKHSLGSDDGLDAEEKLARNRERNREHARKTRLRKKAHLESLQSKAKGLEAERQVLRQQIEECSIASILLGLSSGSEFEEPADGVLGDDPNGRSGNLSSEIALLSGGSRRRFRVGSSDGKRFQPLKLTINGQLTLVGGGKTHVNWKTGSFQDEDGNKKRLTEDQLEHLRRERNRMHAKLTRDRKKCFIAKIEKTIEELESDIARMKGVLQKVSHHTSQHQLVTPAASPDLQPRPSPTIHDDGGESSVYSVTNDESETPSPKRIRHHFSLAD